MRSPPPFFGAGAFSSSMASCSGELLPPEAFSSADMFPSSASSSSTVLIGTNGLSFGKASAGIGRNRPNLSRSRSTSFNRTVSSMRPCARSCLWAAPKVLNRFMDWVSSRTSTSLPATAPLKRRQSAGSNSQMPCLNSELVRKDQMSSDLDPASCSIGRTCSLNSLWIWTSRPRSCGKRARDMRTMPSRNCRKSSDFVGRWISQAGGAGGACGSSTGGSGSALEPNSTSSPSSFLNGGSSDRPILRQMKRMPELPFGFSSAALSSAALLVPGAFVSSRACAGLGIEESMLTDSSSSELL
mmetsp:Transcript_102816/g.320352  ORF Transcript_102816/g.320352 Transcript_102816/m.320352 type:complete len:299 (-) Transcript_102816:643-1539(-)